MDTTDAVMDLAKRRGFLWPSFEVYGGAAGLYDYGPLGAAMKERFEGLWRHIMRTSAVPVAEVACPRVTVHDVLKASGHVDEFTDLVVRCRQGHPQRADHLVEAAGFDGTADALLPAQIDAQIEERKPKCPVCGDKTWTPATPMNLMFQTEIGPGSGRIGYLRPETAQGIFTDFPHLLRYFRGKLPFAGIQVGGANRNEISPRQGMVRLREFHMMEAEVFFEDTHAAFPAFASIAKREAVFVPNRTQEPIRTTFGDAVSTGMVANEALAYFLARTQHFLLTAGMDPDRLRFRQHLDDEMAHYASDCWDAEFHSDRYGWVECVGVADRGCYDLTQHAQHSGRKGDFQVTVPLPETLILEHARIEPVAGILGRLFKGQAKTILGSLEQQQSHALQAAIQDHNGFEEAWQGDEMAIVEPKETRAGDKPLTLTVDGQQVELPPEGYVIREGTWQVTGRKLVPRVIEPSFGVDRILYGLWEHAYEKSEKNGEAYVRMRLSPHVAPIQVAILPLTGQDPMPAIAQRIEADLRGAGYRVDSDASGNIGRRYARQDEVGTPFCITIDDQTPQDQSVTVRDRDTTEQVRVPLGGLLDHLGHRFAFTGPTSDAV